VVLDLGVTAAGHLAVAVRRHRAVLEQRGRECPDGLTEIEEVAARIARDGQERSRAVTVRAVVETAARAGEYLSPAEVAMLTGLSVSTIGRRIRDGSLCSAKVGRARRVARSDVEAFMRAGAHA
jgi:excisionase family DNA binding protein